LERRLHAPHLESRQRGPCPATWSALSWMLSLAIFHVHLGECLHKCTLHHSPSLVHCWLVTLSCTAHRITCSLASCITQWEGCSPTMSVFSWHAFLHPHTHHSFQCTSMAYFSLAYKPLIWHLCSYGFSLARSHSLARQL
jgi:hypothetical protein